MPRNALVTTALPYANGPLHLGHLVGYIQADIWVRARRMAGDTAHFVCADDTHGTPIMLAAEKAGTTPEAFIAGIQAGHERDFAAFGVAFDHYDSTHSAGNRALTEAIYAQARQPTATSRAARWRSSTIRSRACSCPTATSRASARTAARPTSTATTASTAARPMRRPT